MARAPRAYDGGASSRGLRRLAALGGLGALLAGAGIVAALSLAAPAAGTKTGRTGPAAGGGKTVAPAASVPRGRGSAVPKRAIVATAIRDSVPVYRSPGAASPFVRYGRKNEVGQPRVFLVVQRRPGWERVYLPRRPNGATGWVQDRSVSLAYDPYYVVVSLARHMVWVYEAGRRVLATKAGVGRSVSATPRGTYFLVELLKQPDPGGVYGPYAFGTSAFSNVYYHFGGGPGEIGLHGTDYPQGLGTSVSHGCIRIANAAIARLAHTLPLGTPIVIER